MNDFWAKYQRSMCYPDKCNCEPINMSSMIAQPAATYTNLPIILVGLYVLIKHLKHLRLAFLGFLIITTAIGSIFLHMSFTRIGQIADFGGILFIFGWVFFYYHVPKKYFIWGYLLLMISGYSLLYYFEPARKIFAFTMGTLSIGTLIYNEYKNDFYKNKYFIRSIIPFVIGVILFILDDARIYCPANIWVQGHAIWHILVSVSIYYIYKFFEEKTRENDSFYR